jgi:hypothetical protein
MFTFLGGVPKVVVPDNSKLVVFKADRFDLGLNRTYAEMAGHYGIAILPARPYKPRDKSKSPCKSRLAGFWRGCATCAFFTDPSERRDPPVAGRVVDARLWRQPCRPLYHDRPAEGRGAVPELYRFACWKRARVASDYHVEV